MQRIMIKILFQNSKSICMIYRCFSFFFAKISISKFSSFSDNCYGVRMFITKGNKYSSAIAEEMAVLYCTKSNRIPLIFTTIFSFYLDTMHCTWKFLCQFCNFQRISLHSYKYNRKRFGAIAHSCQCLCKQKCCVSHQEAMI